MSHSLSITIGQNLIWMFYMATVLCPPAAAGSYWSCLFLSDEKENIIMEKNKHNRGHKHLERFQGKTFCFMATITIHFFILKNPYLPPIPSLREGIKWLPRCLLIRYSCGHHRYEAKKEPYFSFLYYGWFHPKCCSAVLPDWRLFRGQTDWTSDSESIPEGRSLHFDLLLDLHGKLHRLSGEIV